ncbi:MAG: 2-amino-4-hydroxy-6-hydroxymethyldihydropteridine diphosphokinase [Gammaproteobacteria bacterium]|nr:2-amino-4-hydroxy-6-hydroxymethyldihydropteridine diphosphokinase [Gammaproteobacteria bacterium]
MRGVCVYIGIGSNLDNPQNQVTSAIHELAQIPAIQQITASPLYSSTPMGPQDQPDYVNAVVEIHTTLEPLELLDQLQQIEAEHGRIRTTFRWGARTLDLDILLYGEEIINLARLEVPHPGLHERAFVLYPLYEINPNLSIPGRGKLDELLEKCPADELKKIII